MKKLFGLALIGLMATGTVSAKDTTIVRKNVVSSDSYGAITVKTISSTTFTYTCNSSFISSSCEKDTTKWSIKKQTSNGNENVATIDGDGETRLNAIKIPKDIAADSITYDRKFTLYFGKGFSTVTFPFSFTTACVDQASYGDKPFRFYKAVGVDGSSVVAKEETSEVSAHQPYIVKAVLSGGNDNGTHYAYISFKTGAGCSYTLKKNYDAETDKFVESKYSFDAGSLNGTWNLIGTYENVQFNETNKAGVYGFASKAKTVKVTDENGETKDVDVDAGSFVKAGAGASVPPMRAYLKFRKNAATAKAAAGVIASIEEEQLPEVITVKFLDGDGETESIAQLNTRTGEIVADKDAWFDLKGRKLNHKPSVKGTYYNNGQKVIIK